MKSGHTFVIQSAFAIAAAAALTALSAWANDASPVGLWKNVDDVSGKPRALIRITESNESPRGRLRQE